MTKLITNSKTVTRPEDNENDVYITPAAVVDAALSFVQTAWTAPRILDPGAGTGRWGEGARRKWRDAFIYGVELDPKRTWPTAYDGWEYGDFRDPELRQSMEGIFDLVIGNPPYGVSGGKRDKTLAEKFVRYAWDSLAPGGVIVYLLKTVFLEGDGRFAGLFREMPVSDVYVSASRIPFRPETNGNGVNTYSYSVFVWRKPYPSEAIFSNPRPMNLHIFDWKHGKLQVIP